MERYINVARRQRTSTLLGASRAACRSSICGFRVRSRRVRREVAAIPRLDVPPLVFTNGPAGRTGRFWAAGLSFCDG